MLHVVVVDVVEGTALGEGTPTSCVPTWIAITVGQLYAPLDNKRDTVLDTLHREVCDVCHLVVSVMHSSAAA